MKRIVTELTEEKHARLKAWCAINGLSISEVIRQSIDNILKEGENHEMDSAN